jgi:hypothetical protein
MVRVCDSAERTGEHGNGFIAHGKLESLILLAVRRRRNMEADKLIIYASRSGISGRRRRDQCRYQPDAKRQFPSLEYHFFHKISLPLNVFNIILDRDDFVYTGLSANVAGNVG